MRTSLRSSLLLAIVFVVFGFANAAAAQAPDVLFFPFEEGAGTVTSDAAIPGSGGFGALTPLAALQTGNAFFGSGALLSGPNAYDGAVVSGATFPASSGWTIEFWTEMATPTAQLHYAFGNWCGSSTVPQTSFGLQWSGNQVGLPFWLNGVTIVLTVTVTPYTGNWVHFAIVADGAASTVTVYMNGLPIATSAITYLDLPTLFQTGMIVGGALVGNCFSTTATAPAALDDFRVWSVARSAADIAANFTVDLNQAGPTAFVAATPMSLVFNPATGGVSATGTVGSLSYDGFTVATPNVNLPNGAAIVVAGNYTGTDLQGLTDITFSPLSVRFVASPAADELLVQNIQTAIGAPTAASAFDGASALVVRRRPLLGVGTPSVARVGQGSNVFDQVAAELTANTAWSLMVETGVAGPRIRSIGFQTAPSAPAKTSRLTTDGFGTVLLGDIGMTPGAQLIHLFAPQPAIALGTGPLLGLELTPAVIAQLQTSFPTTPFRVLADANGDYAFLTTPGTLPPGFTVDTVTVELVSPNLSIGYVSPARRVTF